MESEREYAFLRGHVHPLIVEVAGLTGEFPVAMACDLFNDGPWRNYWTVWEHRRPVDFLASFADAIATEVTTIEHHVKLVRWVGDKLVRWQFASMPGEWFTEDELVRTPRRKPGRF